MKNLDKDTQEAVEALKIFGMSDDEVEEFINDKPSWVHLTLNFIKGLFRFILLYAIGVINRIVLVPFPFINSLCIQDIDYIRNKDAKRYSTEIFNVFLRLVLFVVGALFWIFLK